MTGAARASGLETTMHEPHSELPARTTRDGNRLKLNGDRATCKKVPSASFTGSPPLRSRHTAFWEASRQICAAPSVDLSEVGTGAKQTAKQRDIPVNNGTSQSTTGHPSQQRDIAVTILHTLNFRGCMHVMLECVCSHSVPHTHTHTIFIPSHLLCKQEPQAVRCRLQVRSRRQEAVDAVAVQLQQRS